jgi:hypothetical protein
MAKKDRDEQVAILAAVAEKERRAKNRGKAKAANDRGNPMRAIYSMFPLLLVPVALYILITLMTGASATSTGVANAASPMYSVLAEPFFSMPMISGVKWVLTKGDAIVLLSILFLFLEIVKSTSTGTSTILNHSISLGIFILCLVLFLMNAKFATSTFFILMCMALLDVLAGVVVTIVSARRDFGMENEQ